MAFTTPSYRISSTPSILFSLVQKIPFFFVFFYAIWTIDCHIAILFKLPYWTLTFFFWKALFSSPVLVALIEKTDSNITLPHFNKQEYYTTSAVPIFFFVTIFSLISISIYFGSYTIIWCVLLLSSFTAYYLVSQKEKSNNSKMLCSDISLATTLLGLSCTTISSIILTSLAVRPDADDAYYLSIVTQALDHPDIPILYYESMYGLLEKPMALLRRVHTYEILVATFAQTTTIDHLLAYYIIFPALSCLMLVATYFLILKRLLHTNIAALLGTISSVLILFFWGDAHRTFGNFAFVRFFQGKTILVTILIPFLIFLAWRFLLTKKNSHLLSLLLGSCAATGFSVNAILLVPLSLIMVILGALFIRPKAEFTWKNSLLLLPLGYPILLGIMLKLNPPGGGQVLDHFGRDIPPDKWPDTRRILGIVLGDNALNMRSAFALTSLLTAPLVISSLKYKKLVMGLVLAYVLFLFFPGYPLNRFLTEHASANFIWRTLWICPFPLFLGVIGGSLGNTYNHKKSVLLLGLFLLCFALMPHHWTLSKDNNATFTLQYHKLRDRDLKVAYEFMPHLDSKGKLFAPQNLSVNIPALRGHPPLAYVRNAYLRRDKKSIKQKIYIEEIITGSMEKYDQLKFFSLINEYEITSIIFRKKKQLKKELQEDLLLHGFVKKHSIDWYELWVKTI